MDDALVPALNPTVTHSPKGSTWSASWITVAFNPGYLRDGLTAAVGESIRLDVRDGLKPGVLHGDGDEFTYLVMPVRLPAAVP